MPKVVFLYENEALCKISTPTEIKDIMLDMSDDGSSDGLRAISTKPNRTLWGRMLL